MSSESMETGRVAQFRSSTSDSSWCTGASSSRSYHSDEDLHNERVGLDTDVVNYQAEADTMEFSPALGRPDRVTTIRQLDGTSWEDFVVRASDTANHVLVMGSPSVNLACPCPAVCNVIDGQPRECHAVKYDPTDGVLESHIQDNHPIYFEKMGHSLCIRNEKEENLWDVPEDVKKYVQYLRIPKTLPAWTREDLEHLFPSQIYPDKVMLQTVVKDKNIHYKCPIPPCRGGQEMTRHAMCLHLLHEPGHRELLNNGSRIFERCQECECNMHWGGMKMLLHVRAMHPELLDEPHNFTEPAKTELAKLVGQIRGKVIGRAIGDRAGTKVHFLYSFRCPMQTCKQAFSERDHLEWHIKADHQQEWNKGGTRD